MHIYVYIYIYIMCMYTHMCVYIYIYIYKYIILGSVAGALTTPLDVAKTRIMLAPPRQDPRRAPKPWWEWGYDI